MTQTRTYDTFVLFEPHNKPLMHCFQGIPKKMKELEFAHVLMVGTGANMAIYVLRDTEEEDQVGLCKPQKY